MRPISRQVADRQEYPGRVDANKVEVYAQTSGLLSQVFFQAGAEVHQGDRLVATDPRQYQIEVNKAEAELMGAEARLSFLGGSAAFVRLGVRPGRGATAKAGLQLARARLDMTTISADQRPLRQPLVTPGTYVKAGTTLLTTIVATEPLYVDFDIDASTFLALQRQAREGKSKLQGATVQVRPPGERTFLFAAASTSWRTKLARNWHPPRSGGDCEAASASGTGNAPVGPSGGERSTRSFVGTAECCDRWR